MKIIFALMMLIFSINVFSQAAENFEPVNFQKGNDVNKLLTAEDQEVFKNAEKIEILSINEHVAKIVDLRTEEGQRLNQKGVFHGYKIKKTVVASAEDRRNITKNLFSTVGKSDPAKCFEPRHGIRATYKGQVVELLICFQCKQVYAFNGKGFAYETISEDMQTSLDRLLGKSPKKS